MPPCGRPKHSSICKPPSSQYPSPPHPMPAPHMNATCPLSAGRGSRGFLLDLDGAAPRKNLCDSSRRPPSPQSFKRTGKDRTALARCPQDVASAGKDSGKRGVPRQNKRSDFPMMPLCGRPEQYSCTRGVDREAAARKRRAFVLPPRFPESFPAFFSPPPPPPPPNSSFLILHS